MKTIEVNLYIEVEDSEEGKKIIDNLVITLSELRYNKAYLNGWMAPVESPKPKKSKSKK
jgi:hypothetical protein